MAIYFLTIGLYKICPGQRLRVPEDPGPVHSVIPKLLKRQAALPKNCLGSQHSIHWGIGSVSRCWKIYLE